jgi:hypothetical protein
MKETIIETEYLEFQLKAVITDLISKGYSTTRILKLVFKAGAEAVKKDDENNEPEELFI